LASALSLLPPQRRDVEFKGKRSGQWIRYVVVAAIALWLVIGMLRVSGIDIF
jgi:hypothetical protein